MGISGWRRIRWRRDAGAMRPECLHVAAGEGVEEAFRQGLRGIDGRRAPGFPGIGSRGIAASEEPAQRDGKAAHGESLAHDVSNPLGAGRRLGSQPRAKTSMTIMRAPQRGHGQGAARGASGVTSGCGCGSAMGGSAPSSARAVAMFSARLALAKSP